MWFIQPKQDYVALMPWKHADEPAVMSWQIRARDYNTFVANLALIPMGLVCLGGAYMASLFAQTLLGSFLLGWGMFLFGILIAMSITHQTTIIIYRFTEASAEVCSWKPQIDSVKPVLKWVSIILLPIVGVVILMDPGLAITSIGPLGIGLMAWMMGSSDEYQKMQRNSRHDEMEWKKTEIIRVWRKRNIISLTYQWKPYSKNSRYRPLTHLVYCYGDELEKRIQFFRKHLPDAKYEEGKINI
ncbi:hypothetical protein [Billgrantia antri]|uniref:Uncharacterized protein n=1 Tax=Billgrantia antri TaxID=2846777 RepID=A0ABS6ZT25_9GAMM|nr:hypothetical protein [Halomonas antri]MBW6392597.1 hypothetical protein [Halomonas antri]